MPPVNDDLADATLVDTGGSNVLSVSNVDATAETQETSEGYPGNTVWYRVEITDDGDATFAVTNATFDYWIEIYQPLVDPPTDFSDVTDGFSYNTFLDGVGDGTTDDQEVTITSLTAGDVLYILVTDWDFGGSEGTLTLEAFLPLVCTFDAEDGANLGSSTVSLSGASPQWVKDTQYREITPSEEVKGDWEYTESFSITFTGCAAGKYAVDLYNRYGNLATGDDGVVLRVLKNGKPQGGFYYTGYGRADSSADWESITTEDLIPPNTTLAQTGGPRYYSLQEGDVLSFHYGSTDDIAARWMEVQQVRLRAVRGVLPLPSWRIGSDGLDTWPPLDLETLTMVKSLDDVIYVFDHFYVYDTNGALNVMTFQMTGDDIVPVSGDTCLDPTGGQIRDIKETATGEVICKDFTVMPNGDIYACWGERVSTNNRLILKHYDASGDSWSLISNDVWGHGSTSRALTYVTMDNDGEDVFIAWGEGRQTSAPIGYWWRCKKYDVSGSSFSELGSGQTAYSGAAATDTIDATFQYHLRMKCSPAGVPWVVWPAYDPDEAGNANEHVFAWYWDGSSWADSGVPDPTLVPASIDTNDYSDAAGSGNYVAFATYGLYYADITFCHHDGPNEYPALLHQYVWNSDEVGGGAIDCSTWVYWEYDGTDWGNELRIIEAVDVYADMPNQLAQARDSDPDIQIAGGWTQGFSLDNDGRVPYVFSQKGYRSSTIDHVYCARINSDGTGMEEVSQGFADTESAPSWNQGGWIDVTTNGGCIVNGKPVLAWASLAAAVPGVILALLIGSSVVSMNWRSSDRAATSRRVLVGGSTV